MKRSEIQCKCDLQYIEVDVSSYAALNMRTLANMAIDFAPDGICVNVICPGWIQTPLVEDWFNQQKDLSEARKYIYGQHPLGRIDTSEECGYLAAFLASDEAAFITGAVFHIDGGVTLGY